MKFLFVNNTSFEQLDSLLSSVVLDPQNKESRRDTYQKRQRGRAKQSVKDEIRNAPSKKTKKRSKCLKKKVLTPHSGLISTISDTAKTVYNTVTERDFMEQAEPVADVLENIYLLVQNLRKAADTTHAFHIILAHIKLFTKKSISGWIMKFLTDDLGFQLRNRSASETLSDFGDTDLSEFELDVQAGTDQPTWLKALKSFQFNWETFAACDGGKTFCKVVSMCAAMGLCDLSNLDISWGKVKIFSLEAYKKQVTATDLTTAILETVVFFAEGGYRVFETGKIESFFFSDDSVKVAEARYFEVIECAPLVKAGNLERIKDMDDNDYSLLLDKAIDEHTDLYVRSSDSWVKKSLQDRLTTLKRLKAEFNAYCVDGGQRVAPFSIYTFGKPGVGKSTVYDVLIRAVLNANNFNADDERIVTIKDSDDFDSTMRSSTNGAVFDDLGNTMAQFTTKSPTDRIIEFKNNVSAYANMAEADMKGKVRIAVKCIAATSNLKARALARIYSNAAYSFVRRFDVHLEVRVKPEFALSDGRLDSKKVIAAFGSDALPDCYEIDVGIPDEENKEDNVRTILTGATFKQVVAFCVENSRDYFSSQRAYLERAKSLPEKLVPCPLCHMPNTACSCCVKIQGPVLKNQVGEETQIEPLIEDMLRIDAETHGVVSRLPDWVFENEFGTNLLLWLKRHHIKYIVFEDMYTLFGGMGLLAYMFLWLTFIPTLFIPAVCFLVWIYLRKYYLLRQEIGRRIARQRDLSSHILTSIRQADLSNIMIKCAALYAFYRLVKMGTEYMYWKNATFELENSIATDGSGPTTTVHRGHALVKELVDKEPLIYEASFDMAKPLLPHSFGSPESIEEIKSRDQSVNPWANVNVDELPKSTRGKRHSPSQFVHMISKATYYMRIYRPGRVNCCDAFIVDGKTVMIPNHVWENDETLVVDFIGKNRNCIGSKKKVMLSKAASSRIPNQDLCLCDAPGIGIHSPMYEFFFDAEVDKSKLTDTPAQMVYRNADGDIQLYQAHLKRDTVHTSKGNFDGYGYVMDTDTFEGMCMGTWVSFSKTPSIVGFHLAGKGKIGGAGIVSVQQIKVAMAKIHRLPGVIETVTRGSLLTNQYGKEFFISPEISPKSPLNFLTADTNIETYGSVTGYTKHVTSRAMPTLISEEVEAVCEVEQKWGKPRFHPWKPWQTQLTYSADPSRGVDAGKVSKAVVDYLIPLLQRMEQIPELKESIKPLTRVQTVSGIDGMRFIDKMPGSTGSGYPLGGKKEAVMVDLPKEEYPDFSCPKDVEPVVWNEVLRIKECYLSGERAYPIFKTCLKDEPTKLESEKVRGFQAAPIGFQCCIREYFLPIARALSLQPFDSECAVGINAQGPEWDALAKHIREFGPERILAGDYSKYDLRMPAQLVLAAFDVMITIAEKSGNYTETDLKIMKGIATDVAYPVMAFNGDLVQLFGSNPSGQNLTVYINSICNSLLLRCAYYTICEDSKVPFKKAASMMTYGDDAKGSVSEDFPEFNHIAVAKFLADHDMKFTMPDKTSTPTEFMTDEDADFLKRRTIFNEETGMFMGALDESSIFKSLHCVLRSDSITPEEQSAQNIDGALREWFLHGKDIYEKRRTQMKEVARRTGIEWLCNGLDKDYEFCMDEHKSKYKLDQQSGTVTTFASTPSQVRVLTESIVARQTNGRLRNLAKYMDKLVEKYPDQILITENNKQLIAQELEARSLINEVRTDPSHPDDISALTEADQLMVTDDIFGRHGFRCVGKNLKAFGDQSMGEIDAVYDSYKDNQRQIVVVEAKLRGGRKKARQQLQKYGKVMELLLPTSHIRTYMIIGVELFFVTTYGQPTLVNYADELEQFNPDPVCH